MVELHDARYLPDHVDGVEVWRLAGKVVNHPYFRDGLTLFVSCPVGFSLKNSLLVTESGSEYHIKSWGDHPEEVIEQIQQSINSGGFEVL